MGFSQEKGVGGVGGYMKRLSDHNERGNQQ